MMGILTLFSESDNLTQLTKKKTTLSTPKPFSPKLEGKKKKCDILRR